MVTWRDVSKKIRLTDTINRLVRNAIAFVPLQQFPSLESKEKNILQGTTDLEQNNNNNNSNDNNNNTFFYFSISHFILHYIYRDIVTWNDRWMTEGFTYNRWARQPGCLLINYLALEAQIRCLFLHCMYKLSLHRDVAGGSQLKKV